MPGTVQAGSSIGAASEWAPDAVTDRVSRARDRAGFYRDWIKRDVQAMDDPDREASIVSGFERQFGQMGAFRTMIKVGILLGVGVVVLAGVFNGLPSDSSGPIANETDNIENGVADALGLAPVVLLVLVAVVILNYIDAF